MNLKKTGKEFFCIGLFTKPRSILIRGWVLSNIIPTQTIILHLYLLTFSVAVFLFSRDVSHFFFPGLLTWVSSNAMMSSLRLFILSQTVFWTLDV